MQAHWRMRSKAQIEQYNRSFDVTYQRVRDPEKFSRCLINL